MHNKIKHTIITKQVVFSGGRVTGSVALRVKFKNTNYIILLPP